MQSQAGAPAGVRLNFVDAPPHEAFNTDVAALREVDGALAVIDIVEGSSSVILTCGKLRQCLSQARSIKPVMVLTKLDRAFLELQLVNLQTAHAHTTHDARRTREPPHAHAPHG